MKRSTKKALRIATAAVAGFGLLIGYLSYRNAQIARELDSEGVTTSAVVIGRHTEERTFHNRRRAPTHRQITRIEYEFTVDGKTYRNDVSGLSGSGAPCSVRRAAQSAAALSWSTTARPPPAHVKPRRRAG